MKTWNVIVGMDFSECGERAFRQAVQLASRHAGGAQIHIAHAVADKEMTLGSKVEKQADAMGHAPRQIWDRVVKILETEGLALDAVPIWQHVRLGSPVEVITQVAADYEGDLVVVGTHGRTGVKRLVMGSVAETLVRDGRFPVLVAHVNQLADVPKTVTPDEPLTAEQLEARKSAGGGVEHHVYRSTLIDAWRGFGRPTNPGM
ncbi:MAG: universal stress protein [Sandaracinus sp.]|nr:universal stress protein [Sandaracinus sp.]MCB9621106.1 universal stress protein [Sandaracinus sp.]MCB9622577.1 universal stress protein [Sandaracinus sp.]MCB9635632.1 universal stress protein [Sandaracinus sp.]